jgi:hypothetical protein
MPIGRRITGIAWNQQGPFAQDTKIGIGAIRGSASEAAVPPPTQTIGPSGLGLSLTPAGQTPSPVTVLIGLIGLLIIMKVLGELDSTAIEPRHIQIGGYNLIAVTVASIVGIALAKLVFTRWNVPGVSALVQYV